MENNNKTYLDRMHEEHAQLKERINKLQTFIQSNDIFKTLPLGKRVLMIHQLSAMTLYANFLHERINLEEEVY